MSTKIEGINQNYDCLDAKILEACLENNDIKEMDINEAEVYAYQKNGSIPNKIAKSNASNFGLRHAYWDVWVPEKNDKKGVWQLQKDASGNEVIVRTDEIQ